MMDDMKELEQWNSGKVEQWNGGMVSFCPCLGSIDVKNRYHRNHKIAGAAKVGP